MVDDSIKLKRLQKELNELKEKQKGAGVSWFYIHSFVNLKISRLFRSVMKSFNVWRPIKIHYKALWCPSWKKRSSKEYVSTIHTHIIHLFVDSTGAYEAFTYQWRCFPSKSIKHRKMNGITFELFESSLW